jgi:DNA-binding GntR family transcriptional regulator
LTHGDTPPILSLIFQGQMMSDNLIRHKIYERLRADILSCALTPGLPFREGELAEKFGVSKSPIRDALQRLESEGLVEIEPRRGHRVAPISIADAYDILGLREILEAGALRTIIAQATDEELADLDRLREADTTDMNVFAAYNREFHLTICRASGNRRLEASMAGLMENYDRLCIVSLTSGRDETHSMVDALSDHNMIIDALQARNAAAAIRASANHVRKSRTKVMRGLESRPVIA